MGDLGMELFGGSKSKSSQSNVAFPYLKDSLSGTIGSGGKAGSAIASLLGLNGGSAQNEGFNNWRNSTGYQFGLDQGSHAITSNAASKGLLNSGSTLKSLNTFGQNYASTKYGDYMSQLQNLLGTSIAGAGVLSDAGKVASSKSRSAEGADGFIGDLLAK